MSIHCAYHIGKGRDRTHKAYVAVTIAAPSIGVVIQCAPIVKVVEGEGGAIQRPSVIPFITPAVVGIYREIKVVGAPAE